MKIIAGSIDLNKIDKGRIVAGKNGAKYYNISIIVNDEKDKYGNDVSIIEGQTKEERTAKTQRKFLGNGRTVYGAQTTEGQPEHSYTKEIDDDSSLPF